jgi:hypothetical protein
LDTVDVDLTRPVAHGATGGGVTQNENEAMVSWAPSPPTVTPDQLKDARWLSLGAIPVSTRATAVVMEIAAQVANYEATSGTRKTSRRQSGLDKQRQAVAAIVGGLLRHWGRRQPHAVFRSRTPAAFTGGPVAARQYLSACDALVALGLIHQSRSIRYGLLWDDGGPERFLGKAPRLWPTQVLLDTVGRHGPDPGDPCRGLRRHLPDPTAGGVRYAPGVHSQTAGERRQGAHPKASARRRQNTHERLAA